MSEPEFELTPAQIEVAQTAQWLAHKATECANRAREIEGQPREPRVLSTFLLLRALSHYQALMFLVDQGFGLEVRTLTRGLVEVALCIAYLHEDPKGFVADLEQDGTASQVQQAKVLMKDGALYKRIAPDKKRELNEFVKKASEEKPQILNLAAVAQKGKIPSMYLPYRVFSADAGHVSPISLARHMDRNEKGELTHFKLGRDEVPEIFATLDWAIRAMGAVVVAHSLITDDKQANADMQELTTRAEKFAPPEL